MKTLPKYKKILLEALIYFSSSVQHPTKVMLYKMLAQFDYRHYKATGMPATGLEYETWEMGDVPAEFHKEITRGNDVVLPDFMKDALYVTKEIFEKVDGTQGKEFTFKSRRKPNFDVFTPRQITILNEVIDIFKECPAWMASVASHERNTPWYRTKISKGMNEKIDLIESADLLETINLDVAREKIQEMRALIHNYGD